MADSLLRVYLDPDEIGLDGYPYLWHKGPVVGTKPVTGGGGTTFAVVEERGLAIKDLVRERAGHRCVRCGHPYRKGEHGRGEWSPCDDLCTHTGEVRIRDAALGDDVPWIEHDLTPQGITAANARLDYGPPNGREVVRWDVQAKWRVLTVHHLDGVRHNCLWFNLVSLCQRCHLSIQTRVVMNRPYRMPHTPWFRPYVAGFYAWKYLGQELTRDEVEERMEELLALEQTQDPLF